MTLIKHSGAPAYLADDAPGLTHLVNALAETWGKPVVFKREGGSIPVATTMQTYLGVKSLLTGLACPTTTSTRLTSISISLPGKRRPGFNSFYYSFDHEI